MRATRARRRRRPTRYASLPFAAGVHDELRELLDTEHRTRPFRLCDPRDAARRVDRLLRERGMRTVFVRGALDLGGAELDHVWTVADGHVVDVAVPCADPSFLPVLRAYVAGDVEPDAIDREASRRPFAERVLGAYDEARVGYVGLPVFGSR